MDQVRSGWVGAALAALVVGCGGAGDGDSAPRCGGVDVGDLVGAHWLECDEGGDVRGAGYRFLDDCSYEELDERDGALCYEDGGGRRYMPGDGSVTLSFRPDDSEPAEQLELTRDGDVLSESYVCGHGDGPAGSVPITCTTRYCRVPGGAVSDECSDDEPDDPDEPCACDTNYDPVCGVDGTTYGNRCELDCEGIALDHEGECEGGLDGGG